MIDDKKKSHPYISLNKHNDTLLRYNRNFKENDRLEVSEREQIDEAILYHDYGKQNKYFQERIEKIEKGVGKKKAKRDLRHDKHAVLSALKYMESVEKKEEGKQFLENINMILGHHGQLVSFENLLDKMYRYLDDSDLVDSLNTIEHITDKELRAAFMVLEDTYYDEIEGWTIEDATKVRTKFSRLVDADRLSAMRRSDYNHEDLYEYHFNREAYYYRSMLDRKDKLSNVEISRIMGLRNTINIDYKELETRDYGIFSLVLPTGLGKTVSAIDIAERNKGKVVYVVPYLSISDQTWEVLNEIYKNREYRGMWNFLARHDSRLNEKEYDKDENDTQISVKNLIESWHSKVIVTTTVQFFESLLSTDSSKLRKLHNTFGATILIDEPQSIPYEKWNFLKEIVNVMAKTLKWKVIYMSATPPTMPADTIQLVKNEEVLFKQLNRTRIQYAGRTFGFKAIMDWCDEAWRLTCEKNQVLWILNIEKGARKVYKYALERVTDRKVVFISGKLPSVVRMYKLNKVKEHMKRGEKILVVSTQVLEAGVDLDFDGVVRDMAPLPILLQVAGRLNRKWLRDTETVYVLQLIENTVYSDYEFRHTGAVLFYRDSVLEEKDYYQACKEYYALCEEMPPAETPLKWREEYINLQESSMHMIESVDYQKTAICKNISEWLDDTRYCKREESRAFRRYFRETTGFIYKDIESILNEVGDLEKKDHKKMADYRKLKELYEYLGWFNTNCSKNEAHEEDYEGTTFTTVELPIQLIGY